MRESFSVHGRNGLFCVACVVVDVFALATSPSAGLPVALAATALASLMAWALNYRLMRGIADTPVSTIGSAAQGYVEISGYAEEPGGMPIRSPLTDAACVWFYYEICLSNGDVSESGSSDDPFIIRDATGPCVVDPEGARVFTSRREKWTNGGFQYLQHLLLPRDHIYALGEFSTLSDTSERDMDAEVGALLAEWKKNKPELLKRFDLDHNGTIDLREWELARRQARREVAARQPTVMPSAGTNVLRRPAGGKPFLITNLAPKKIRFGYAIWTWVHAVTFITAGGIAFALF